jgi:hypothetical protein
MRRLACGLLSALAACATGSVHDGRPDATAELADRWHYQIELSEDLSRMDATLCFEGAVPKELRAGKDDAAGHLLYARWLSPGAKKRLHVERGRIQLDARARDACVAYGVELRDAGDMASAVRRVGRDLVASPNVWLWRPELRSKQASATLSLKLPVDIRAALPFAEQGGRYQLGPDAFAYHSYAAFGRFRPVSGEHLGVPFDAALLEGPWSIDEAAVERWLRRTIEITANGPVDTQAKRLHVILVPVEDAASPVPFGTVTRGGEGSVLLFVSSRASEQELVGDWVLPHELSHLFIPYVPSAHAWFSEGLASYYQEVLRARAGVISAEMALHNLARAMRSAAQEGTGRLLEEESRAMHQTYAYRPVYWGGAAYFLMADVELRRLSQGASSLDSVLTALQRERAHTRSWTLEALVARMDELAGVRVFSQLADVCLARPFPEVEPTLLQLGVPAPGNEPSLEDAAPLAAIGRAIFAVQERK